MLVKVFSSNKGRMNKSVKVFIDNKAINIQYNADCIAEVAEEILPQLLEIDQTLSLVDKEVIERLKMEKNPTEESLILLQKENGSLKGNIAKLKTTNEELLQKIEELEILLAEADEKIEAFQKGIEPEEIAESEVVESSIKESEESKKITRYSLQKMNPEELKDIVKSTGIPEDEWVNLSKTKLIDFILKKVQ